jgi:hypothetical protein
MYGYNEIHRDMSVFNENPTFSVSNDVSNISSDLNEFENMTVDEDAERFRILINEGERTLTRKEKAASLSDFSHLLQHMPPSTLPPIFPHGPLNLNPDETAINYKKSHASPNEHHWIQVDAEEMARLFNTGTIRPLHYHYNITANRTVMYVNPICVEKLHDDGSLKLRTRITIGGDRIVYPYDTRAVTAEMEALKILLNCMISENANWTTIDLTDFYLGTDLPHPEYIRIQTQFVPQIVIDFFQLKPFIDRKTLYCSVHKAHYGLPQAV